MKGNLFRMKKEIDYNTTKDIRSLFLTKKKNNQRQNNQRKQKYF